MLVAQRSVVLVRPQGAVGGNGGVKIPRKRQEYRRRQIGRKAKVSKRIREIRLAAQRQPVAVVENLGDARIGVEPVIIDVRCV